MPDPRRLLTMVAAIAAVVACTISSAASSTSAAPAQDAQSVYEASFAAFAAGDLEGALAYYSDDAVLTDIGSTSSMFAGKPAIALVLQLGMGGALTINNADIAADGDQVTVHGEWSDVISDAAGVERYLTISTITVTSELITRYDLRYDMDDAQTRDYLDYNASQPPLEFPGTVTGPVAGAQAGTVGIGGAEGLTAISIAIATAGDAPQLADLRLGTCASPGGVISPLASVVDGASLTIISRPLAEIQAAGGAVHVRASDSASAAEVACGALPAAAPAPAPTAQQPAASAPAPAPVAAPSAGFGSAGNSGSPFGTAALAILALGAVSCAGGAAAVAVRR